jgi:cytochrome c
MVVVAAILVASAALSLVHPWGNQRSAEPRGQLLEGSTIPEDVRGILEKKCADCHSNQTHWPVYSRLAPASWLMEHDVHGGRSAMNLSNWTQTNTEGKIALLTRIAAEVRSGEMPPKPYTMLHPANRLTESDKQHITAWTRAERKHIRLGASAQKENHTK